MSRRKIVFDAMVWEGKCFDCGGEIEGLPREYKENVTRKFGRRGLFMCGRCYRNPCRKCYIPMQWEDSVLSFVQPILFSTVYVRAIPPAEDDPGNWVICEDCRTDLDEVSSSVARDIGFVPYGGDENG